MSVDAFLDTNVLVYAAIGTGRDERKRLRALDLIDSVDFGVSAQVLQEFYVTVRRKAAEPLSAVEAMAWIDQLVMVPCQPLDHALVRIAVEICERHGVSYWDAAIVAAAEALGAEIVYSEDFNDGQIYGRVRVINPFR